MRGSKTTRFISDPSGARPSRRITAALVPVAGRVAGRHGGDYTRHGPLAPGGALADRPKQQRRTAPTVETGPSRWGAPSARSQERVRPAC